MQTAFLTFAKYQHVLGVNNKTQCKMDEMEGNATQRMGGGAAKNPPLPNNRSDQEILS